MTELFLYVFISSLLTGVAVLLYNIGVRLFHRHIGIKTRSFLLRMMLFFQPVSIAMAVALKYVGILPEKDISVSKSYFIVDQFRIYPVVAISCKSSDTEIWISGVINIATYVWLALLLILIIADTVKYFRFKDLLRKELIPLHSFSRPRIEIAKSRCALSPFLIGIVRPIIIIPENGLNPAEMRLAIKHELAHYRRHDVIFKMLAEFLRTINFFNPAFYILQKQFGNICELMADDIILINSDAEKRRMYCKLLLNLAEKKSKNREFCLNLSKEGRLLSERLCIIMNHTTRKRARKLTVIIACAAALSALSVIGYATYKFMPDTSNVVYASPIPQEPVSGFSLLEKLGNKLPENFVSVGENFFPTYSMYSVSGKRNGEAEYSAEKLAYGNGQVIVMTDDNGCGFELAKGQTVSISIIPDYSPEYNNFAEEGELVCVGYILNGDATELETATGRVPKKGLELSFTAQETGTYYFYAINACAGLQNYESVKINIL